MTKADFRMLEHYEEIYVVLMWNSDIESHYVICDEYMSEVKSRIDQAIKLGDIQITEPREHRISFFNMDILPEIWKNENYIAMNQHRIKK